MANLLDTERSQVRFPPRAFFGADCDLVFDKLSSVMSKSRLSFYNSFYKMHRAPLDSLACTAVFFCCHYCHAWRLFGQTSETGVIKHGITFLLKFLTWQVSKGRQFNLVRKPVLALSMIFDEGY